MALYEYICKCGLEFEEFRDVDLRHTALCPRCYIAANKKISKPAIMVRAYVDGDTLKNGTIEKIPSIQYYESSKI